MLVKEGPVNASAIHSQKGAGHVSRLEHGVMGIVVFVLLATSVGIQMMRVGTVVDVVVVVFIQFIN